MWCGTKSARRCVELVLKTGALGALASTNLHACQIPTICGRVTGQVVTGAFSIMKGLGLRPNDAMHSIAGASEDWITFAITARGIDLIGGPGPTTVGWLVADRADTLTSAYEPTTEISIKRAEAQITIAGGWATETTCTMTLEVDISQTRDSS